MGTTEQVIKNYLRKIYDKLGVSDRLELALYCLHNKIIQSDADEESWLRRLLAGSFPFEKACRRRLLAVKVRQSHLRAWTPAQQPVWRRRYPAWVLTHCRRCS